MSQDNVERARAAFEAWQRGDLETWLESIDPDVEVDLSAYPLPGAVSLGRGRDHYVKFLAEYRATWDAYDAEVKEVIDAGESVVMILHERVRGRESQLPIERDLAQVITVESGRATRIRFYRTRTEALEAVGLSH